MKPFMSNKKIKLKEGQELVTVKKVKLLKTKGSNNLQPMYNEEIAEWLLNDPDPNATLDKIKKEGKRKTSLSRSNPIKLMKEEMTEEDYINFWKDIIDLRKYYAIEYFRKNKKIERHNFSHLYYLPQLVYNANYKYWKKLIMDKRYFEHPEFMVVDTDDIETEEEEKARKAKKSKIK
jgi:hypothetical protein